MIVVLFMTRTKLKVDSENGLLYGDGELATDSLITWNEINGFWLNEK